jgi:hypothetical protein
VAPDQEVLFQRITRPGYARGISPKPLLSTLHDFETFFHKEIDRLDPDKLETQLRGVVEEEELLDLGNQICASLRRLHF